MSKPLTPSPLTLIKPFNLSANTSKMLMKKRIVNNHVDEINAKIVETMKRKLSQKEENEINRFSRYSAPIQSPNNLKISLEEDMQSLSNRIEKYCIVSKQGLRKIGNKSPNNSPMKLNFNKEIELDNGLEDSHAFLAESIMSSSIGTSFLNVGNIEEKSGKESKIQKNKNKILNKNLSNGENNKQADILSFESVLEKTRAEKNLIVNAEKDKKRAQKINQMKKNSLLNKENVNNTASTTTSFSPFGDNEMMLVEK